MFTVFNYSSGQTYTGILDTLNNVSDCKYDFSPYKRLTGTYTGNKIYIERLSDNAKDTITTSDYDSNGDINSSEISTWSGGGDVVLLDCYCETASGEKAYQTDNTKAPKIVVSGVWQSDGPLFDGINDHMQVDDYNQIQITSQPFSTYCNFIVNNTSIIFAKSIGSFGTIQFGLYAPLKLRFYYEGSYRNEISLDAGANKVISSYSSNTVKLKNSTYNDSQSYSSSMTNRSNFFIGARDPSNYLLDGNLKTILILTKNAYSDYDALVAAGI